MKKMAAILLAATLILSACGGGGSAATTAAPASTESTTAAETTAVEGSGQKTYTLGTYTASAQGNNGPVELSVTFSEDAITKITIGKHGETTGISDAAFEKIPAAIIKNQSLAVDAISGATYTSQAILDAVADCVAQAGGDAEALRAVAVKAEEEEENAVLADADTDVLVIGGGGAGLSAALSASQNGARVILVEKLSALGGNTFRCGGAFNTYDPEGQKDIPMTEALSSAVEKVLAHEDVSEEHAKLKAEVQAQWDEYKASGDTMLFDSPEWHALQSIDAGDYEGDVKLVRTFTSNTLDTLHWLADNGVEWTDQVSTVVGALWNRSHQTPNNSGADIIAALETTVSEFNELVKAGKPDEFGRTTWENTIETGPFYAPSFSPAVHHTMGGLEINSNAEVLDADGNVIPGFYAAGEVTGGIHGTNRVGGNAVPDALCFGKIAGENAAKN